MRGILSKPRRLPKRHPPPSLRGPRGAGATRATGGAREAHAAHSRHQCPLPTPTPPRSPQPRPGAASACWCRARRARGAYLCDSHAETPGRCGGAGAACGGGGRGRRRAPGGGGKGVRRGSSASRAPREAQPSLGAALRAGSAQGPLVGARPPLVADVSPECAFIIDEPPSPQEGEAGRKGARERARAGGRGEEERPGTRYKGGGGRRRRRKRTPARRRAPRLGARSRAAGHRCWRSRGPAPRPAALTPSGPRPPRGWSRLGPGTCWVGGGQRPGLSVPCWPRDAGEVTP